LIARTGDVTGMANYWRDQRRVHAVPRKGGGLASRDQTAHRRADGAPRRVPAPVGAVRHGWRPPRWALETVAVRRGRNGLATMRPQAANADEEWRGPGLPPAPGQATVGVRHDRSVPGKRGRTITSARADRPGLGRPPVAPFTSGVHPERARRVRARRPVVDHRGNALKEPVSAGSPRARRADATRPATPKRERRPQALRFIAEPRRKTPVSEVLAAAPAHRGKHLLARHDRADPDQKIDLGCDAPLSSRPLS
jgi:hypothetical protein